MFTLEALGRSLSALCVALRGDGHWTGHTGARMAGARGALGGADARAGDELTELAARGGRSA
jgi:hypothetical protein